MGSQASPANLVPLRNNRLNIVSNLSICKAILLIFINSYLAECIWPIGVSISNCWLSIVSNSQLVGQHFLLLTKLHLQPGSDWQNICFQNLVLLQPSHFIKANAAKDSQLAVDIENEGNWRFKYQKHLAKLGDVTASCSKENANIVAMAGLNQLLESFVFIENDTNDPTKNKTTNLKELGSTPYSGDGKRKFKTHIVEGEQSIPSDISFPYKNETLDLSSLEKKMAAWVEYGTCEPDCCNKVSRVMPSISEGLLKGKWFVLLGAGSEMGPLKFLLTFGANVIAIRTRKKSGWIEMGNFATNSAGKLFIPVSEIANDD